METNNLQVQQDRILELLICPICLEYFKDPKILPCLHTFCDSCLEKIVKENVIECPSCKQQTNLNNSVKEIPNDFFKRNLIEILSSPSSNSENEMRNLLSFSESSALLPSVKLTALQNQRTIEKQVHCEKHGEAYTKFCKTCELVLCEKCLETPAGTTTTTATSSSPFAAIKQLVTSATSTVASAPHKGHQVDSVQSCGYQLKLSVEEKLANMLALKLRLNADFERLSQQVAFAESQSHSASAPVISAQEQQVYPSSFASSEHQAIEYEFQLLEIMLKQRKAVLIQQYEQQKRMKLKFIQMELQRLSVSYDKWNYKFEALATMVQEANEISPQGASSEINPSLVKFLRNKRLISQQMDELQFTYEQQLAQLIAEMHANVDGYNSLRVSLPQAEQMRAIVESFGEVFEEKRAPVVTSMGTSLSSSSTSFTGSQSLPNSQFPIYYPPSQLPASAATSIAPPPSAKILAKFVNTLDDTWTDYNWLDNLVKAKPTRIRVCLYAANIHKGQSPSSHIPQESRYLVYHATGAFNFTPTTDYITSTASYDQQYDFGAHNRKIVLSNEDVLTISGKRSESAGWAGSLGNGYGVVIYSKLGGKAKNIRMTVLPFLHANPSSDRYPRKLGGWKEGSEIGFIDQHSTFDTSHGAVVPSFFGTFVIYEA